MRAGTVVGAATEPPSQSPLSKACPLPSLTLLVRRPQSCGLLRPARARLHPESRSPGEEWSGLPLLRSPGTVGCQGGAGSRGCCGKRWWRPGHGVIVAGRLPSPLLCAPELEIPDASVAGFLTGPSPTRPVGQVECLCPP